MIANSSRTKRDPTEIMDHSMNNGAGTIINASEGAYHTDQYQLFLLIFSRAMKDPRRTLDPSKATTYIVPYDLATDAAFYNKCPRSDNICYTFRKCPLAPRVIDLLIESPWYHRKQGKDHLMIVGMNYAMNYYIGKPMCKQLLAGACYNCTKLAIDDYSFLQSTDEGVLEKGDGWHAVPFPADFHWTRQVVQPFPWENRDRPILCSYVGSAQSYSGRARRLRQSIAHYCHLHPDLCAHMHYGMNGTRHSYRVEGHNPQQQSAKSVFCFQPIGDLPTRKGLFDAVLQGCIPVTFDALTASTMYTWHWEEEFWNAASIEFPHGPTARRDFDPVLALKELSVHNKSLIERKQELIRSRVFELQYSLDGIHEISRMETKTAKDGKGGQITIPKTWPLYADGAPMRDAYDIIMDHVLGWHSGAELDVRNGTIPECWNGEFTETMNKCVTNAPTPLPSPSTNLAAGTRC
jgi:Exostosin family